MLFSAGAWVSGVREDSFGETTLKDEVKEKRKEGRTGQELMNEPGTK